MIYTTGTIAGNGNTLTGTGTNFAAAGTLIRNGCTVIVLSTPAQVFQITAVNSATQLAVTPAVNPAIPAGTRYAILLSDSLSVDGLALGVAETFGMYQAYMGGFADVMQSSSTVAITINGKAVTVPGLQSVVQKDPTGTVPISLGGTGATNAAGARKNLGLATFVTQEDQSVVYGPSQEHALVVRKDEWGVVVSSNGNPAPLGTRYGGTGATTGDYWGACTNIGAIRQKTARFMPGDTPTSIDWKNSTGFITGQVEGGAVGAWIDITSADEAARMQLIGFYGDNNGKKGFGYKVFNPNTSAWYNLAIVRDTNNTTVDSNGFIKVASPIVKIYGDGRYETNDESEGVTVTRLDVGQYLIDGCEALNSDAAWGGIYGGFEIPTDRNKQPLIWLDYEVSAEGTVLVKTYHRTYPDAPAFARNERAGYKNGDPVDIPAGLFISVRVEMPENSLYNQKLKSAEEVVAEKQPAKTIKDAENTDQSINSDNQ